MWLKKRQKYASYPNRTSDLVITHCTSDTPYHWAKEAVLLLFVRSGYWSVLRANDLCMFIQIGSKNKENRWSSEQPRTDLNIIKQFYTNLNESKLN
jgi:hypothetical protein